MQRFSRLHLVVLGLLVSALILGIGWWMRRRPAQPLVAAQRLPVARALAGSGIDSAGFKRATNKRTFSFPADHGPHPDYQTEWWYYTGNLSSADGHSYGYQFTIFRTGLSATPPARASKLAATDVYLGHFAFTDGPHQHFYAHSQAARGGGLGVAGASGEPYRIFVNNWQVEGSGDQVQVTAATDQITLSLKLRTLKPPTLQGDDGLQQQGTARGNAAYYYSFTRMVTEGTVVIEGKPVAVTGLSWFDHEWGTQSLGPGQIGWNWFALHLPDGRDVMWYEFLRADGTVDRQFGQGSITAGDGSVKRLRPKDVQVETLGSWSSPNTGTRYPARWRLQIPNDRLDVQIEPLIADQELRVGLVYWEGAVTVHGMSNGQPVTGSGYVELAGYADMQAARQ